VIKSIMLRVVSMQSHVLETPRCVRAAIMACRSVKVWYPPIFVSRGGTSTMRDMRACTHWHAHVSIRIACMKRERHIRGMHEKHGARKLDARDVCVGRRRAATHPSGATSSGCRSGCCCTRVDGCVSRRRPCSSRCPPRRIPRRRRLPPPKRFRCVAPRVRVQPIRISVVAQGKESVRKTSCRWLPVWRACHMFHVVASSVHVYGSDAECTLRAFGARATTGTELISMTRNTRP
jgi:hypothetical protein